MLSTLYPDYNWLPWKFSKVPFNYWQDLKNHRKFLDWAATQLNVKEMSDWYKISQKVNKNHKNHFFIQKGNIFNCWRWFTQEIQ
jgi:hypothetical protein